MDIFEKMLDNCIGLGHGLCCKHAVKYESIVSKNKIDNEG